MPTQRLYQQSRAQEIPLKDTHHIEASGSRMHEATLVNRFLRGLQFFIPVYDVFERTSSSKPDEIISDFLTQMKLEDNITYGALMLLYRLKRLVPRNASVALNGHTYFMAAYSLSAKALVNPDDHSYIPSKTHSFVISNALISFQWIDIETARQRIYDDIRDDLTLDNILPRFKSVVDNDFRSDREISCPHYPPSLVTQHPKFLYPRRSRDDYISIDNDEIRSYYTPFHNPGVLSARQSPLVKDKVGSSNRG